MDPQRGAEETLLIEYPRAAVALRQAYQRKRFGLVLGAGVSRAFSFHVPDWKELLDQLASHSMVQGLDVIQGASTPTARADILYRHFCTKMQNRLEDESDEPLSPIRALGIERRIQGEWRSIIRDILYADAPNQEQLGEQHPYLKEYLEVIVNSPMTITYNFDSYLEMMLASRAQERQDRGRSYETVYGGTAPFRSSTGVVYHPNGYLPYNVLEHPSDNVVFSEEEFGNQLLDSIAGGYSSLAYHLTTNTCLFIGISLADENLRHFLRRNAVNNPGHYHYLVKYVATDDDLTSEHKDALLDYHYNVYNLITLFLTNERIAALGRVIRHRYEQFAALTDTVGCPKKYVYYLTGIPGIGKTTALRHLSSLGTYDEWMEEPSSLLAVPHPDLKPNERRDLDNWIARQFRLKNEALQHDKEGIFVVERAPLDPLAFEEEDKLGEKARRYYDQLLPTPPFDSLCEGSVIFLHGDTKRVSTRIIGRSSVAQPSNYLNALQDTLGDRIYPHQNVRRMYSTDWSINRLVREVARAVHREDYQEVNVQSLLESLKASG